MATLAGSQFGPGFNGGLISNAMGGQMTLNGGFTNLAGGTLNNSGMLTADLFTNQAGGTVNNAANFRVILFADNSGAFNNSGTLTATGFNNRSTGVLTNTGMATLAGSQFGPGFNGGLISNAMGGQMTLNGGFTNLASGTLNNSGMLTADLFTNQAGGTVNNAAGGLVTSQVSFTNSGLLNNDGVFANNGTLQNHGTIMGGGVFNNVNSLANTGTFQVGNGGLLNNAGSFGNVQGGGLSILSGGTLINSGSLSSDYLSGFGTQAGSAVVNTSTGTMALSGNTIAIGGALRNNGTLTLVPGPVDPITLIQPPPPPLFVQSTSTLSGTGTVNAEFGSVGGAQVFVDGVMAPGDPTGKFTIQGNYVQNSGGTLDIFLVGAGAGQYGVLDVSGMASLDGTVDFIALNGFTPVAGDDFTFLLFSQESGNFANPLEFTNWMCPVGDTCTEVFTANSLSLDISGLQTSSTPEPSSLLLLATSVLALGMYRRWTKSTARQSERAPTVA
jgi:hypothetical protein